MGRFFALVGAGIGTLIGGVMLTLNENTIGYWFLGIAGPLFILGVYDVIRLFLICAGCLKAFGLKFDST